MLKVLSFLKFIHNMRDRQEVSVKGQNDLELWHNMYIYIIFNEKHHPYSINTSSLLHDGVELKKKCSAIVRQLSHGYVNIHTHKY
jgi:hypothetical protein